MENEDYFDSLDKALDKYTFEEIIERLKTQQKHALLFQEWLDSVTSEFDGLCKQLENDDPEAWEEAVAWAQEYLENFKPLN